MPKLVQIAFLSLKGALRITPPLYADNRTGVDPADLTKFAPHGNGVYGYQEGMRSPIKTAPPQDDIGGFLYLGNNITREDFDALMAITGVQPRSHKNGSRDYAVFYEESAQPGEDGYLVQIRLVSKFALRHMFGSISDAEYETFPDQEVSMSDAFWGFMENERSKHGTFFGSPTLDGLFGGDGDFMQEKLSFGFMVENNYHHVYRMWSRAHLVTK